MGEVYEAFDRDRGVVVAVKTLPRASAEAVYRFKREFRALADMEHPNLISLGELIEDSGQLFFTMDYIDGIDFLSYVRGQDDEPEDSAEVGSENPTMKAIALYDEARLRLAACQLAQAITALHQAGMVHRDIKPSNILMTRDHRLVLLDFGLVADVEQDEHASTQNAVGTVAYMAPEQALSGVVGPAADWYSFGVVMYEALTGTLPYSGRTPIDLLMKKQQYEPPPPRARNPGVARDLDGLCADLLVRDPTERPSATKVLDRLGVADSDGSVSTISGPSRFTQTVPFVGRTDELRRLRAGFEDSRKGPVVTVINGASGLGKSELARRFAATVQEENRDAVVLAGRCYERESMAYKAFDAIADALSRYMRRLPKTDAAQLLPMRAGLLSRLFPVLQRVEVVSRAPLVESPPDPQEFRRRAFEAFCELLARLSQRHPLILIIDDLQWTDLDSVALLQELFSLEESRMLLIATRRPVANPELERALAVVDELAGDNIIELEPLSEAAAMELAGLLLPGKDQADLGPIAKEAGGHPLFLHELARYREDAADTPATLDEMLWRRIAGLGRERRVLDILSAAGGPISHEVAAGAAEMELATYMKAVSTLRIAYLARSEGARQTDNVAVYHDRVREVVLAHLDDETRHRGHERLAIALESSGAAMSNPHALVRHAEAAGDLARAARYAEAAAEHAVAAMAFDRGAEFLRTALRLGQHSDGKTRELRESIAECLVNAGRGAEAAELFLSLVEEAEPVHRRELQRRAVEQLLSSGHISKAMETLDSLLAEMGIAMPSSARRALLGIVWNKLRLRIRGVRFRGKHEREVAGDELARLDVLRVVGEYVGMVDNIRGAYFQSGAVVQALRLGERNRLCEALTLQAVYVAREGGRGLIRGQELIDEARTIAPDQPALMAYVTMAEGLVAYFAGRFRGSEKLLREADEAFENLPGVYYKVNNARAFRLFALQHAGMFRERRRCFYDYLRDAQRRGDLYVETSMTRNCHAVWLMEDDPDEMLRRLAGSRWPAPEDSFHLQHWYELEAVVDCGLYQGSLAALVDQVSDSFDRLRRSLLLRVQTVRCLATWLWGRFCLARSAEPDGGERALLEAARSARRLERERMGFANVWAGLLRAGIASHRDPDNAPGILRATVAEADDHGMAVVAAVARRRRGELIGGEEGAALVAEADTWMTGEAIVNPERMTEVFAPGFALRRRFHA